MSPAASRAVTTSTCGAPCSGGMTLAAYLGYLAAGGEHKVANTSWAVCLLDMSDAMDGGTGLVHLAGSDPRDWRVRARKAMWMAPKCSHGRLAASERSYLELLGQQLSAGKQAAGIRHLGLEQRHDAPAGEVCADLLGLIEKNPYRKPGTMEIAGRKIDMRQVNVGAYVIGGVTDHITWKGCYGTARMFGEKSMFVLANAGHLQSLLNPPGAPKAHFFAAPAKADSPEDWAERHPHRR